MRPCVEKCRVFLIGKKLWLHITKALSLSHFSWIKVNYPIRNIWDNYRKKYWKKKKVKIGVKSKKMVGGYLRKTRGIGYEWSSKVEKVLYSRAFFNASSGAENVLKTYFVFGVLTKGFHKGPKLTLLQKFRQKSRKLTTFWVKIGWFWLKIAQLVNHGLQVRKNIKKAFKIRLSWGFA